MRVSIRAGGNGDVAKNILNLILLYMSWVQILLNHQYIKYKNKVFQINKITLLQKNKNYSKRIYKNLLIKFFSIKNHLELIFLQKIFFLKLINYFWYVVTPRNDLIILKRYHGKTILFNQKRQESCEGRCEIYPWFCLPWRILFSQIKVQEFIIF